MRVPQRAGVTERDCRDRKTSVKSLLVVVVVVSVCRLRGEVVFTLAPQRNIRMLFQGLVGQSPIYLTIPSGLQNLHVPICSLFARKPVGSSKKKKKNNPKTVPFFNNNTDLVLAWVCQP